jgi:D-glycero-D-manno-heptose 1,7-bisphosphate phosphatase
MKHRAVFLDLNGTLVMPILVEHPRELRLVPDAAAAVARLSSAGFICPVVTVQSRIAKGTFSSQDFQEWFEDFAEDLTQHGAIVVGPYVCPHRFAEACPCKKPHTYLYELAAADHHIDPCRSFVVGDSAEDVEAAARLGARGCLVRTGWAESELVVEKAAAHASYVAASLTTAVDWILDISETQARGFPALRPIT